VVSVNAINAPASLAIVFFIGFPPFGWRHHRAARLA
jgi:hypothetical protein